ncbi:MAG: sugar kinase [Bauldia sp.]|nr:sugar kinase [Bauldia sp.]
MSGKRLLSVGALTQDTIFKLAAMPAGAGKFIPDDAVQIAAGMATAAAASAARQGGDVSLWASVGGDAAGRDLLRDIAAEGVDCSLVRTVHEGRSAIATILVDEAGERLIIPYYDPLTQADPDALPCPIAGRFDAVLVDVRWPGAAALALGAARDAGIPAILDADVGPRPVLERLARLATHIAASRPAAAILCGEDASTEAATVAIAEMYPEATVLVTDGGRGAFWFDRATGTVRHLAAPQIKAVDTLSAGDVFHGCLALAIGEGWPLVDAIRHASAAAAIKCLRFGGWLGAPSRAETLAFLDGGTGELLRA